MIFPLTLESRANYFLLYHQIYLPIISVPLILPVLVAKMVL